MPKVSALPGLTKTVIIRQKPSSRVFVFLSEHETSITHFGSYGMKTWPKFRVPVTCWEWHPADQRRTKIRVVESTDKRIRLRMFRLGNVHSNENICWGVGNIVPWDLREIVCMFWEASFNDDLTNYGSLGLARSEFEQNIFPHCSEFKKWCRFQQQLRKLPSSSNLPITTLVIPSTRRALDRIAEYRRYASRALKHANNLREGERRGRGGLQNASERAHIDGRPIGDIDQRISYLNGLISDIKSRLFRKEGEYLFHIGLRERVMGYFATLYYQRLILHRSWADSYAAAFDRCPQLKEVTWMRADIPAIRQFALFFRSKTIQEHATVLYDTVYREAQRRHHATAYDRWWGEREWEKTGSVDDYTTYIMGDERQIYEDIIGVGWAPAPKRGHDHLSSQLPLETWKHYPEGVLFPVWQGKDRNTRLAMVAGIPFVGRRQLGVTWTWTLYDKGTKALQKEIEEVFA